MRLFIGIKIPDELGQTLLSMQKNIVGAKWRGLEHFHITLAFLGEVDFDTAEKLDEALGQIDLPAFELSLRAAGHFGENPANAIWLGVGAEPTLNSLHEKVTRAAKKLNIPIEARKFLPHVTMAYLSPSANPLHIIAFEKAHSLYQSEPFLVDRFYLYASHLTQSQSHYTTEAEYPLRLSAFQ